MDVSSPLFACSETILYTLILALVFSFFSTVLVAFMDGRVAASAVQPSLQRWTHDDNIDVAKCYVRGTLTPRLGYTKILHEEWSRLRSDRLVTSQRLADQWQYIEKKIC